MCNLLFKCWYMLIILKRTRLNVCVPTDRIDSLKKFPTTPTTPQSSSIRSKLDFWITKYALFSFLYHYITCYIIKEQKSKVRKSGRYFWVKILRAARGTTSCNWRHYATSLLLVIPLAKLFCYFIGITGVYKYLYSFHFIRYAIFNFFLIFKYFILFYTNVDNIVLHNSAHAARKNH